MVRGKKGLKKIVYSSKESSARPSGSPGGQAPIRGMSYLPEMTCLSNCHALWLRAAHGKHSLSAKEITDLSAQSLERLVSCPLRSERHFLMVIYKILKM